jgi:hypothetical protein
MLFTLNPRVMLSPTLLSVVAAKFPKTTAEVFVRELLSVSTQLPLVGSVSAMFVLSNVAL